LNSHSKRTVFGRAYSGNPFTMAPKGFKVALKGL